jgi:hypothetical protein
VKAEIAHPHTPTAVKQRAAQLIHTIEVQLTGPETQRHQQVRALLQGNSDRDSTTAMHSI